MNGGGPTAQIIEREGWKTDKDFVGHRKAITCVSFNSNMLRKSSSSSQKGTSYCCCAIGSRDRSVSIWLTSLKRPLVVIHELFLNSVLDLSWSRSGYHLMACSWDGSVAYIEFEDKELGQVVSIEEKENLFQRMYGKKSFITGPEKKTSLIIEDPDWIQPPPPVTAQTAAVLAESCSGAVALSSGGSVAGVLADEGHSCDSRASRSSSQMLIRGPTDKQIETRTADGKRRITPVFIPPPVDDMMDDGHHSSHASNHSTAASALVPPTFSSSTESKSRIVVEKRDEVTRPGLPSTTSSCSPPPPPPPLPPPPPPPNATAVQRKEMSSVLLNRRFERNEPERRVVTVVKPSSSAASVATTGISITKAAETGKTVIPVPSAQKSLSVSVSGRSS